MPYLKIMCPGLEAQQYYQIAKGLTDATTALFYSSKSGISVEDFRNRVTVHFVPYKKEEFYIAAIISANRPQPDITIELSDWYMSVNQQRKVAKTLTPVIAGLFKVSNEATDNINIRFHSYPPTDFAIGGKLLSDLVPLIGRLTKRIFN